MAEEPAAEEAPEEVAEEPAAEEAPAEEVAEEPAAEEESGLPKAPGRSGEKPLKTKKPIAKLRRI